VFAGQTGLFGGAKIAPDGSNINPVALNLLNARNPDGSFLIPSPQTAGGGVNYTAVLPGHYDEDQFNTNLDVSLTKTDRLSTKFFFSNSTQNVPFTGRLSPDFRRFMTSITGIWRLHTRTSSPRRPSISSASVSLASPVEASPRDR
jgi:hypothetical protein